MEQMLFNRLEASIGYLRAQTQFLPRIGIVLGTGLGALADEITIEKEIPYSEIPYMPASTVVSHAGKLLFGELNGMPVVALAGRFHYYEGYEMEQVTYGIRLLKMLGVDRVLLSNVAGGLQADMVPGEIVMIRDHINLMPANPLRGANDERLGPRFPDMMQAYDPEVNNKVLELAKQMDITARLGVYAALPGPNLETPAEYNYLHTIGADLVGMSTVPEVIVARHMGLKVNVFSMVSNVCYPIEALTPTTVDEVIAVANAATPKLSRLVKELLAVLR